MLDYPPPSKGPLFQFPTKKAFLESPDQWLSPDLYCRSFGHTHTEIWRLKMCLDYRPPSRGPLFQFPAKKAFLETPNLVGLTKTFIVGHLVTPTHKSGGWRCAGLSAPF